MAIVKMGAQDEASEIEYDNTTSGLTAANVKAALDELKSNQPVYINDLTDVTTSSISTNHVLTWNGIAWVNSAPQETFTETFTSSDQTITSAGTLSLAHSLTNEPNLVQLRLKCTTAEHGYSVDDEVIISAGHMDTNRGASIVVDSTNVVVRFGSDTNAFDVIRKDTGASAAINNSSWKFIVKAWS